MQAAEREGELARARSQRLKQAARSLPGEPVSRGFVGRGALEGYPSHYTSLPKRPHRNGLTETASTIEMMTETAPNASHC